MKLIKIAPAAVLIATAGLAITSCDQNIDRYGVGIPNSIPAASGSTISLLTNTLVSGGADDGTTCDISVTLSTGGLSCGAAQPFTGITFGPGGASITGVSSDCSAQGAVAGSPGQYDITYSNCVTSNGGDTLAPFDQQIPFTFS